MEHAHWWRMATAFAVAAAGLATTGLATTGLATAASAQTLAKRYGGDFDETARPLEWTCSADDVWKLKSWEFERGDKVRFEFGPGTLVVGAVDGAAIWAVVTPSAPAKVAGSLTGQGDVKSVLLRFHPKELDDLFPAKTVAKNGPPEALLWARRVVAHQLTQTGWWWDQFPTPMQRSSLVVDGVFTDGARRVWQVDDGKGTVAIDERFSRVGFPADTPMDSKDAVRVFEEAWKEFDRTYAKFQLRPEVDWDALAKRYKPLAQSATTTWEAAMSVALLVEHLRDLHVHVKCGDEWMPQYRRYRPQNGVVDAAAKVVGELHERDSVVRWARTEDGIGYLQVNGVGDEDVPTRVDAALEQLADTWGLIVDIRFNGGGSTNIAAAVAARFVDTEKVYANSQFRTGSSKRTQLTEFKPRTVAPRGPWRYESPVMALFGQRCMSSGDELALMLVQCPQVTSVGDRTAGSSAAPKRLELAGGIVVNVPRWNDCDAEGEPIEDRGVPVQVPVTNDSSKFTLTADPVIEKALELLRKTPASARKPGKR